MSTVAELEAAYVAGEDVTLAQIEKARKAEAQDELDRRRAAYAAELKAKESTEAEIETFKQEVAAFLSDDELATLRDTYTEALVVIADLAMQVRSRVAQQNRLVARAQDLGFVRRSRLPQVNAGTAPIPEVADEWRAAFVPPFAPRDGQHGVVNTLVAEAMSGYHAGHRGMPATHTLMSDDRRAELDALRGLSRDELRERAHELMRARVEASRGE